MILESEELHRIMDMIEHEEELIVKLDKRLMELVENEEVKNGDE